MSREGKSVAAFPKQFLYLPEYVTENESSSMGHPYGEDDQDYHSTHLSSRISPPHELPPPKDNIDPTFQTSDAGTKMNISDFATRMMKKSGWKEGEGLGVHHQGISSPIETVEKFNRGGLGYHDDTLEEMGFKEAKHTVDLKKSIPHKQEAKFLTCIVPYDGEQVKKLYERGCFTGKRTKLDISYDKFCPSQWIQKLCDTKNRLNKVPEKLFLQARRNSNPYEKIGSHIFINRAAVKMANLNHLFEFTRVQPHESFEFADICAGPGGFTEYLLWVTRGECRGFGFTLKGNTDWKLQKFRKDAPTKHFTTHYGLDQTGNILVSANIKHFADEVNRATKGIGVSLVTADGGLDVDGEENEQETKTKQLVLCQFLTALSILKQGGNFVCKVFDLFTPFTVGLIYLLYRHFEEFCIIKPYTSRPANSERYVVFKNLKERKPALVDYLFQVNNKMNELAATEEDVLRLVQDNEMEDYFVNYVKQSNTQIVQAQIEALEELFKYIEDRELQPLDQIGIRKRCLEEWKLPLYDPLKNTTYLEQRRSFTLKQGPDNTQIFDDSIPTLKTKEQQQMEARYRYAKALPFNKDTNRTSREVDSMRGKKRPLGVLSSVTDDSRKKGDTHRGNLAEEVPPANRQQPNAKARRVMRNPTPKQEPELQFKLTPDKLAAIEMHKKPKSS